MTDKTFDEQRRDIQDGMQELREDISRLGDRAQVLTDRFASLGQPDQIPPAQRLNPTPPDRPGHGILNTRGMNLIAMPDQDVRESDFGLDDWERMVGPDRIFWESGKANGATSITTHEGHRAMRFRLSPIWSRAKKPSTRSLGGIRVKGRPRTYRVCFLAFIDPGISWGGRKKTGKLGLGIAGKNPSAKKQTPPSGGKPVKDGFSQRFIWDNNGDASLYRYAADTKGYGDRVKLGFRYPLGRWFSLGMELTINSNPRKADGSTRAFLDGEQVHSESGVHFMSEGVPTISRVSHSNFAGGNKEHYQPKGDSLIYLTDMHHGIGTF